MGTQIEQIAPELAKIIDATQPIQHLAEGFRLGIPLEACEPLAGEVHSRAAEAIVGEAVPVCFRVARVAFRFDREEYDRRGAGPGHLPLFR